MMPRSVMTTTAAVLALLVLAVAFPAVVRAEVTFWTAHKAPTDTYFRANATCYVTFHGNGTDATVRWSNATTFAETSALVQVCDEHGAGCTNYSRPSPTSAADSWLWTLPNAVPANGVPHKVIVLLLNTTTGQTISNGSYVAPGVVGRSVITVDFDGALAVTVGATMLNYTCQWKAPIAANNSVVIEEAPMYNDALDAMPLCVVPNFDDRLAAGTNFTMALLAGPSVVPSGAPFVWSTNAVVTGVSLPGKLCSGQNVSVDGFYFPESANYTYACYFGWATSFMPGITVSSTRVVCPLPNMAGTVTSVSVYQHSSTDMEFIGSVKASFDYSASCTSTGGGDDEWPYWAWILVGLGAVAALTTVMGLAALVYVTWIRSGGEGEYEQLIYADNPIHLNSEQQLPALDRKTFSF